MATALADKTLLPIRAERTQYHGYDQIVLHYDDIDSHGRKMPRNLWVGPPLDDPCTNYYRDPLGVAVLQVMQAFWELEETTRTLGRQRDEAVARAAALQEEVRELTARVKGLERQKKG